MNWKSLHVVFNEMVNLGSFFLHEYVNFYNRGVQQICVT